MIKRPCPDILPKQGFLIICAHFLPVALSDPISF